MCEHSRALAGHNSGNERLPVFGPLSTDHISVGGGAGPGRSVHHGPDHFPPVSGQSVPSGGHNAEPGGCDLRGRRLIGQSISVLRHLFKPALTKQGCKYLDKEKNTKILHWNFK